MAVTVVKVEMTKTSFLPLYTHMIQTVLDMMEILAETLKTISAHLVVAFTVAYASLTSHQCTDQYPTATESIISIPMPKQCNGIKNTTRRILRYAKIVTGQSTERKENDLFCPYYEIIAE